MIYTNNSVVLCKYMRVHTEIEAHTASFFVTGRRITDE